MPYTKRLVHKNNSTDLLNYIMNDEKTDGGLLVSAINCNVDTATTEFENTRIKFNNKGNRVAYHIIQSFSPEDKITEEQANEIGIKLAKELYPDFQCVVATHVDKAHLHNHIVVNAVNLKGRKLNDKLNDSKEGLTAMAQKSNEISKKYGCYIIPNTPWVERKNFASNKEYSEALSKFYRNYKHVTWQNRIKTDLDNLKINSRSIDEFIKGLFELGYDVKYGKYISVKPIGKERYVRLKTISEEYSEENLRSYFLGEEYKYNYVVKKIFTSTEVNHVVNAYYNELYTSLSLVSFVQIDKNLPTLQFFNKKKIEIEIEKLQNALNVLDRENIFSYDDLQTKVEEYNDNIRLINFKIFDLRKKNNYEEKAEKAQIFLSLLKEENVAKHYKQIDSDYLIPDELKALEKLKKDLNINSAEEALEIIKDAREERIQINQLKSQVFDLQQRVYQLDLIKEEALLKNEDFLHNVKVGNNRIDYKNSTDDYFCVQLPYSDKYIKIEKKWITHNNKYGYNILFLYNEKEFSLYEKIDNKLVETNSLTGKEISENIENLKKETIKKNK